MNREMMVKQFSKLESLEKVIILLSVSLRLTVVARDILRSPPAEKNLDQARGMSEINHKILPNALARIRGSEERYPDDILINLVCELFSKHGLEPYVPYVWDGAFSSLNESVLRSQE